MIKIRLMNGMQSALLHGKILYYVLSGDPKFNPFTSFE